MKHYLTHLCCFQLIIFAAVVLSVRSENVKGKGADVDIYSQEVQTPYPFYANLLVSNSYICAGSLIAPNWILTAAHCISHEKTSDDPKSVKAFIGSTYFGKGHMVQSELVIPHEKWSRYKTRSLNDIGLVKLSENVPADVGSPIQLPTFDDEHTEYTGKVGLVLGFGLTENDTISSKLRESWIPIVSRINCKLPIEETSKHQICADDVLTPIACRSDSGGPLARKTIDDKWELIGIISAPPLQGVVNCTNYPLFTKVASYLNWINTNIKNNS